MLCRAVLCCTLLRQGCFVSMSAGLEIQLARRTVGCKLVICSQEWHYMLLVNTGVEAQRRSEELGTAPVPGDKVLGGGGPVRQAQVQQLGMDALKDTGVAVNLRNGFIGRPVVEACKGGRVLLGLELGPHNRHQHLLGQPAGLHTQAFCVAFRLSLT